MIKAFIFDDGVTGIIIVSFIKDCKEGCKNKNNIIIIIKNFYEYNIKLIIIDIKLLKLSAIALIIISLSIIRLNINIIKGCKNNLIFS